ncbi:MAG: aminotransferase class V-fold PLP-dependent enzyme [Planctomycetota bacterium]
MTTRRSLLGRLGAAAAFASTARLSANALSILDDIDEPTGSPEQVAHDEDFWAQVQAAFEVDRSFVNFNNGGVSPAPAPVTRALARHVQKSNEAPAYVMWQLMQPNKEAVRRGLARMMNVDPETVAITRNASESLQICQFGVDLQRGDHVLCCDQDYPRMLNTFRQRQAREGIVFETFPIPVPCRDPDEIVRAYRERITERTRLILCSHVINLTGQVVPVKAITALGRERGIPVIVDGAHAFANLVIDFGELDCDYYATSLHKWLFAPIGTGMLHVKRERIRTTWPLMAGNPGQEDDIRKFEEIGTHQVGYPLAIADALVFHERLGPARKAARLRYLRDLWAEHVLRHERVRLNTPLEPELSNSLGNFRIDGIPAADLYRHLLQKHRIVTTPIAHPDCEGIRVSPSVYSTIAEVRRFCEAIDEVIAHGV